MRPFSDQRSEYGCDSQHVKKPSLCNKEAESDMMLCLKSEPDTEFCTDCHLVFWSFAPLVYYMKLTKLSDDNGMTFDPFAVKHC